jgi:predicted nuclease with TOPRIM domain
MSEDNDYVMRSRLGSIKDELSAINENLSNLPDIQKRLKKIQDLLEEYLEERDKR